MLGFCQEGLTMSRSVLVHHREREKLIGSSPRLSSTLLSAAEGGFASCFPISQPTVLVGHPGRWVDRLIFKTPSRRVRKVWPNVVGGPG